jgi:hypothetical protein
MRGRSEVQTFVQRENQTSLDEECVRREWFSRANGRSRLDNYFYCFAAFDCAVPNAPEMRLGRINAPPSARVLALFRIKQS